jgi:hypothetical protein
MCLTTFIYKVDLASRQPSLYAHEASRSVAIAESCRAGIFQWGRRSGIAAVCIAGRVRALVMT